MLQENMSEDDLKQDEDALDEYEVNLYINYLDSQYDDYSIWKYADLEEIISNDLDTLVGFLIEENIVSGVDDDVLKDIIQNLE